MSETVEIWKNWDDVMIRVAVCDDEIHILKELSQRIEAAFIKQAFPISLFSFNQTEALWRQWESNAFDVLFLDIDMPGMDGVAFGRLLRARNLDPCIIYISNREERVFETFSVAPLRFVRKSLFLDEIDETAEAVIQWWESQQDRKMVIRSRESILSLPIDDIIYVECFAKVQNIVTGSDAYSMKSTLGELEDKLLAFGFLRPHKGYLVNYRHIGRIDQNSLLLRDGTKIPVSKHRITEVKKAYLRLTTQALNINAIRLPMPDRLGKNTI